VNLLKLLGLKQQYRQKLCAVAMVLDTDGLPPVSRAAAAISAMRVSFLSSCISADNPDSPCGNCVDNWTFGTTNILRAALPATLIERSVKRARGCCTTKRSLGQQDSDGGAFDRCADQHITPRGVSSCLWVSVDELALPDELIRAASTRLHTSPVYELVTNHIAVLTRHADALSAGPAATGLGTVNVELVRALLTSAAPDTGSRQNAIDAALLTRIRGYVREHLTDADLTPQLIATAHYISVRQLYKLCADADFSLHHWTTNQRLQGARDELAGPASRCRSIAMVAQRWGFANPTHFSRRFRAIYGMTPREWRRTATDDHMHSGNEHFCALERNNRAHTSTTGNPHRVTFAFSRAGKSRTGQHD
jgi:AraC-like DNA-binding protein